MARDNVFKAVEKAFEKFNIVFLDGDVLSGKTEFAAEYTRRNEGKAVAAFLSPETPLFYSQAFARQTLGEQVHMLVNNFVPCPDSHQIDAALFSQLLLQLQRIARKQPITFVIDGLADSDEGDKHVASEVLSLLPVGQSEFRFLFTGTAKLYSELRFARRADADKIHLLAASLEDTKDYLRELNISETDIHSLYHFCGGSVGLLDKLRTLLVDGASVQDLLTERRASVDKILELEWSYLPEEDDLLLLLAFLAWSQARLSTQSLVELTGFTQEYVSEALTTCRMVKSDDATSTWSIRSDVQRRFIMEKLEALKSRVEDKLIARLIGNENDPDATLSLPSQLVTAGRHTETLKRLTPRHFEKLLEAENSLRPLKKHAEFGLTSARLEDDIDAQIRFSLIQSSISGASIGGGSSLEVEALLALEHDDEASAIALSTPVAEERIQRIAAAAACFGKRGKAIPGQIGQVLREQLTDLAGDLPDTALTSIASDLLSVDIDLALDVVAKLHRRRVEAKLASKRRNARQTIGDGEAMAQAGGDEQQLLENAAELRPFFEAASALVNKLSVGDVLAKIEPLEQSHKLFLLSRWLERHKTHPEASRVALAAISIALHDTARTPRIRDFREIAVVVPHIENRQDAMEVVDKLEAQRRTLTSNGTTDESVRLEMLLLRARDRHGDSRVEESLIDLYSSIGTVGDIGIRTACYAWMLYHLENFPRKTEIEEKTSVNSETTRSLIEAIDTLLEQTADHYSCAKDAIRAVCMADPARAIEIATKLNTEQRREDAYVSVANHIVANNDYSNNAGVIFKCVNLIKSDKRRENLIVYVLEKISNSLRHRGVAPVDPGLLNLWKQSRFSYRRVQAAILTYEVHRLSCSVAPTLDLLSEAERLWNDIHVSWLRTEVGFWVVKEIAPFDHGLAREWLHRVREESRLGKSPSLAGNNHLFLMAGLVGRAVTGLIQVAPNEFDSAIARLTKYVEAIPLVDNRLSIWSLVGTSLYFQKRRDLSEKIVKNKIEPILGQNYENNEIVKNALLVISAPLLYLNHAAGANSLIDRIKSNTTRDEARVAICETILRKQCVSLPFQEKERTEYSLNYAEATDIVALLRRTENDAHIYSIVTQLCNSLASRKNRTSIRRNQVADVLTDLAAIVSEQLPDSNNIKHDGYLIASQAQIYRCRISEGMLTEKGHWQQLLDRAEAISNGADRVVVVSIVASCAGGTGPFADNKWFERVRRDILAIPSDRDRIDRFRWVAEIIESFDKSLCRRILREAMNLSNHLGDLDGIGDCRQKMLDLAHNIDAGFCGEMIDLLDGDEAKAAKKDLKDHTRLLDHRKDAASDVSKLASEDLSIEELAEIASRNLAALNADRHIAQPTKEFLPLVTQIRSAPLPQAYPIWQWILENGIKKATQQIGPKVLPPLYETFCSAADVTLMLVGRSGLSERSAPLGPVESIGPGDRDQVFARLQEWASSRGGKKIQISDPFFGPDDLDIVKAIAEVCPDSEIEILTSRKQMQQKLRDASAEDAFKDAWERLCEVPPPPTDIIVVGFGGDGEHPIHDRWIVGESSGLRLGTSANSLGHLRVSEMSELDQAQTIERGLLIDKVLNKGTRDWQGHKLSRVRFSL